MMNSRKGIVAIAVFAFLSGCGGGGGSSSPPPPPSGGPAPPPPPPTAAAPSFTNVTNNSGINFAHGYVVEDKTDLEYFAGGVAAADYDGDGDIDLFVVRGDIGGNKLYRNDGGNNFTDVAQSAGVAFTDPPAQNYRLSGPTFADMDGDGDHDLFIGGHKGDPSFIFQNNGDGTFADVSEASGIRMMLAQNTISAAFGDYDKDGDLDMFLSHWGVPRDVNNPGDTEHLWRNISSGSDIRFESVSVPTGISSTIIRPVSGALGENRDYTFSPSFADINNDGYPDILSVADFQSTRVFYNNQDGTFSDVTNEDVIIDESGMGSAIGDYDNDGDLDWFVTSIYSEAINAVIGNRLYRNDGGTLSDATDQAGVSKGSWAWAACFFDAENDGDLDLVHVNGWKEQNSQTLFEIDYSPLFISDGAGSFKNQADAANFIDNTQGRALVCADFDNDGDTDLFIIHRNQQNSASLFRNDVTGNNYLSVNLVGKGKNTEAAGARIALTVGGETQMREIIIGSNFTSQNPARQLFGLGTASTIERLKITWPDGVEQTFENIRINQSLEYRQP